MGCSFNGILYCNENEESTITGYNMMNGTNVALSERKLDTESILSNSNYVKKKIRQTKLWSEWSKL